MGDGGGRWRGEAGRTAVVGACLLALVGVVRSRRYEEGTLSAQAKGTAVSSSRPALPDPPSAEPTEENRSPSGPVPGPPAGAEGKRDVDQVRALVDQVRQRARLLKEGTHALANVSGAAQQSTLVQRLNARGLNLSESQCRELDAVWDRWKDYVLSMKGSAPNRHAWGVLEEEVRSRLTAEQASRLHEMEVQYVSRFWEKHIEELLMQLNTRLVYIGSDFSSKRVERRPEGEVPEAQIRALSLPEIPSTLLFPEAHGLTTFDLWDLLKERAAPLLTGELLKSLETARPSNKRR